MFQGAFLNGKKLKNLGCLGEIFQTQTKDGWTLIKILSYLPVDFIQKPRLMKQVLPMGFEL